MTPFEQVKLVADLIESKWIRLTSKDFTQSELFQHNLERALERSQNLSLTSKEEIDKVEEETLRCIVMDYFDCDQDESVYADDEKNPETVKKIASLASFRTLKESTSHLSLGELRTRARRVYDLTSSSIVGSFVHACPRDKLLRCLVELFKGEFNRQKGVKILFA